MAGLTTRLVALMVTRCHPPTPSPVDQPPCHPFQCRERPSVAAGRAKGSIDQRPHLLPRGDTPSAPHPSLEDTPSVPHPVLGDTPSLPRPRHIETFSKETTLLWLKTLWSSPAYPRCPSVTLSSKHLTGPPPLPPHHLLAPTEHPPVWPHCLWLRDAS